MTPRSTRLKIEYAGKDITKDITKFVESFQYSDEQDKSDSISLTLNNLSWIWLDSWMPQLGDIITTTIIKTSDSGTKTFKCGDFYVDDLSFSGRPLTCDIKAVASPINEGFTTTKVTKTWEGVSIKQIATKIAEAAGVELEMSADDIQIKSKEQSKQTDSEFLKALCDEYGYILKIYAKKIVILDPVKLEKMDSLFKIDEKDLSSWSYTASVEGSYTGATLDYTTSDGKKNISASVGDTKTRCLKLYDKAESVAEAERIAIGKVNKENEKAFTFNCKMKDADFITATSVVELTGMHGIGSKFYVTKVKHTLSSKGYEVSFDARKIVERIGVPAEDDMSKYPTLRYSDTDKKKDGYVSIMQAALVGKGYNLPIFGVDGLFFSETRAAVKACQSAAGISVDGVCGPQTWKVLVG